MRHPQRVLFGAAGLMAASLVLGVGTSAAAWATGSQSGGTGAPGGSAAGATGSSHAGGNSSNAGSNAGGNSSNAAGNSSNAGGNSSGGGTSAAGNQPPGNNGTVKIDGISMDAGQDNDPHVSCGFSVSFFGYDGGPQSASITVTPVAPTAGSSSYHTSTGWNVGQRTSGSQFDANVAVPPSAIDPVLAGITPQAQQGYHLRLEVEVTGSQGSDDKYKVFWMQPCSDSSGGEVTTTSDSTPTTSPTTTATSLPVEDTTPTTSRVGTTTPATVSSSSSGLPATVSSSSSRTSAGAGTLPFDAALRSAATPSAASSAVPVAASTGSLAFTGADIAGLSLAGMALIGGGAVITMRSRRRANPDTEL